MTCGNNQKQLRWLDLAHAEDNSERLVNNHGVRNPGERRLGPTAMQLENSDDNTNLLYLTDSSSDHMRGAPPKSISVLPTVFLDQMARGSAACR
jgi:hypothetical protein